MKIYVYLLFLAIFNYSWIHSPAQQNGLQAYQEAESFRKQNRCEEAIKQYESAIREDSDNFKFYFQKGRCELKMENLEAAKHSFQQVVEKNPAYTAAYSLLAKIYRLENDYENAIYYYKQAARFEEKSARKVQYELLLANLLIENQQPEAAQTHLMAAQQLAPRHPDVLYYLAEIKASTHDWEAAKDLYEAALSTDQIQQLPPAGKAKYFYGLGLAHQALGNRQLARKFWERAQFGQYKDLIEKQLAQTDHTYFYRIAVSYYLQGEYRESNRYLVRALELNEEFVNALVLKGKIAHKGGKIQKAISNYEQALSLAQSAELQAKISVLTAHLYLNLEDGEKALAVLETAVQVNPNNLSWQYLHARAAYVAGRYDQAISTLEQLQQIGLAAKERAKYNFLLGLAARKAQETDIAEIAFKRALVGPYKAGARLELDQLKDE